jgi:hypothetical protein
MPDSKGFTDFVKNISGAKDGWGVSTSGLVLFLVVLMISVIMLIVNGIYFVKVFDGSNDEDLNNYWSRGGALTLAIFNFVFAALLFIEFIIVINVLIKKNTNFDEAVCLKSIGGSIDKTSGLPNGNLATALSDANLAYTTADKTKLGYVTGVANKGSLPTSGLYIGPDYLTNEDGFNARKSEIKDDIDKYALYNVIANTRDDQTVADLLRNYTQTVTEYNVSPTIVQQITNKRGELINDRVTDTAGFKNGLLATNPPFDPAKNYGKDAEYNIRRLTEQERLFGEPYPLVPSDKLANNVFNPVSKSGQVFTDLYRRSR